VTPGTVLVDSDFCFRDGQRSRKLLVVLNNGADGVYLVAKTTSNPAYKSRSSGCNLNDRYPNFYLPPKSCCLDGESWVDLGPLYSLDLEYMLNGRFAGRISVIGDLGNAILQELIECFLGSVDITQDEEKMLLEVHKDLCKPLS
jgi:hypothetical protein